MKVLAGLLVCGALAVTGALIVYRSPLQATAHEEEFGPNLRSVSSITRFINKIKPEEERERENEERREDREEKEGERFETETEYLESLRERLYIKCFPDDTPNEDQYFKASAKAKQMPKASFKRIKGSGLKAGSAQEAEPKWEFVGPTALTVPYNIYYGPNGSALNGRIGGLAFDPTNSAVLYMAAPAGGIWKTVNSGVNWTPIGDHFPSPYVGDIAVHPKYNNVVIAGLGDSDGGVGSGNGIMRSEDGGTSWVNIPLRTGTTVSDVIFDPDNTSVVMVSMSNGGGLFRSTNMGYSFTSVTVGSSSFPNITDMSVSKPDGSGNRYYAAQVRNSGMYLSTDGGSTWTASNSPSGASTSARSHIEFSHVTPNRIYYLNDGLRKVYQGDIAGTVITWTDITGNFPTGTSNYNWSQSWYDNYLTVAAHTVNSVKKDFVYVGLITVAAWDGTTWTDIGQTYTNSAKTHNDQHCFAVFPGDESKMVIGNDGGVWPLTYTAPAGANPQSWAFNISSSSTLGITMFYSGAFHPTNAARMMGGSQDNASPVSTGNLSSWVNRTGGDGMGCAINVVNPQVWYGSAQSNGLYRTSNGWSTQSSFGPSSWGSDSIPFVTRMATDPTSPNPLYVGTNYLWRYNPTGATWDARLGNTNLCPSGGTVLSITVAPSDANVIYVGTTNGDLWRSGDKGATWRKLDDVSSPVVPSRSVTCVSVSPTDANDILLTLSGSGVSHVQRIANTTLTTPAMTNVSGTGLGILPDIQTSSITRDDVNPSTTWYIATDIGVFMTINGGTAWTNATEPLGLPVCEVSTVEWVAGTGYLNAATYGRGMWRIKVRDSVTVTDTTLVFKPSAARFDNRYTVKFLVNNTGGGTANAIKITSASLKMKLGATTLTTALPVNVGQLDPAEDISTSLIWTGSRAADSGGTVTIAGTYVVGGVTRNFTYSGVVSFP